MTKKCLISTPNPQPPTPEAGQVLIYALGVVAFLLVAVFVLLSITTRGSLQAQHSTQLAQASNLAEAGIDKAIDQLKNDPNFPGETGTNLGAGTFSTTVTGSGSNRTITATGLVSGTPQTIRVAVAIGTTNVQFFYGVQVDEGGVTMGNNATIVGNVFSNGSLTGQNGASVSGTAIVAGGAAPLLNQSQTITSASQTVGQTSNNADIAQSWIPDATNPLTKISLHLAKVGAPANLPVKIVTDNNNLPSQTTLATGTLAAASIGTTASWIDLSLASPTPVNAGTRYWIILDGTTNANNYYVWSKDSNNSYAAGQPLNSSDWNAKNPSWVSLTGDQAFKIYLGGASTKIENIDVTGDAYANTIQDLTVTHDAYFQTLTNTTVLGTPHPNSPDTSRQDLPISDGVITDWKNDAAAGGITNGNYLVAQNTTRSLGPQKITGDLIVENNATLIITGTLYVAGNLVLNGQNGLIRLDQGYGTNSGVVVTDGWMHVDNNFQAQGSGTAGSFVILLTTANHLSGPFTHHNAAVDLHNGMEGSIIYAGVGMIHFHNGVNVKEATGWALELDNTATVTYDNGLANTHFTSGPGGGWAIVSGTWQIVHP